MNLPPPPFVGGAFAQVRFTPRPLPRRLPHIRSRCPRWSGCAYLRRMRSRPKAGSRAIRRWRLASARLAASRTSRNSAFRICRALWSRCARSIARRAIRLLRWRALPRHLADLERDLVLLLDAYHLRPTGADRVTNPEEIDIEESEEERADETENASSFASFTSAAPPSATELGGTTSRSRGRSRTSTQPARTRASVTERSSMAPPARALLASFLENRRRTPPSQRARLRGFVVLVGPNRRRRGGERRDGKRRTVAS